MIELEKGKKDRVEDFGTKKASRSLSSYKHNQHNWVEQGKET